VTAGMLLIVVAMAAGIAVVSLMALGECDAPPSARNGRAGGDDGGSARRGSPRRSLDGLHTGELAWWPRFEGEFAAYVRSGARPPAGPAAPAPRPPARAPQVLDRLG
jgi:hypothetical protein